jgi:F-type H+-transporting ATPase subunit epsilon
MILEIVTPEATLVKTEVESVSVPGIKGEFQMLRNHAAIVSVLTAGKVRFKGSNVRIEEEFKDRFEGSKEEYTLNIESGTVEMKDNRVIVLAD